MPRKSTKLRIQQGKEMLARYESAGITNIWPAKKSYNFVRDMLFRLESGRGWSKRQREWFDACVDAPTPVILSADEELENRLRAAAVILGQDGAICVDFADRLRGGKNLTEKQEAWAQRCLTTAEEISSGNAWTPNDEELSRMRLVASMRACYSNTYWATHPAQSKALSAIEMYLEGDKTFITKENVARAEHAVRGSLKKIDNPRFSVGSHGWLKTQGRSLNPDGTTSWVNRKDFVLICSGPYVNNGSIRYDVLVNGESKSITGDNIAKR